MAGACRQDDFRESSVKVGEERAKVKVHFEAGGSVSRPQNTAQSGTICPEKGL